MAASSTARIAAFITAANRAIADPRARPQVVVRAPPLDPRAPIVDLADLRGVGFLRGQAASLGAFSLEDAHGNRILDMRAAAGMKVALAVPAGDTLYLRTARGESVIRLTPRENLDLETLPFAQAETRTRGAMDTALRRGLFATEFGPSYYRGFVDHSDDLLAVDLPELDAPVGTNAGAVEVRRPHRAAKAAGIASGVLALGAGILGAVAWQARSGFRRNHAGSAGRARCRPLSSRRHAGDRGAGRGGAQRRPGRVPARTRFSAVTRSSA